MKYVIFYITLIILIASCASEKKLIKEENIKNLKDSVVIKDSVVVKFLTKVFDSIVYKDSVVVVVDSQGRVIAKERFYIRDRLRQLNDVKYTNVRHNNIRLKNVDVQHKFEKKEKQYSIAHYAYLMALSLSLLLVIYIMYKSRSLWKFLFKAVKH